MPSKPLKDILFKHNPSFRYSKDVFTIKYDWPVHRIFEEAFFNCDEEDRRRIKADIIKRGSGIVLWNRYMEKIEYYIEQWQLQQLAYYQLTANGIEPDIKTAAELKAIYAALREFSIDIAIIPKNKTFDTNASRKGVKTRQKELAAVRKRIKSYLKINYNLSQNRINHLANLLTTND